MMLVYDLMPNGSLHAGRAAGAALPAAGRSREPAAVGQRAGEDRIPFASSRLRDNSKQQRRGHGTAAEMREWQRPDSPAAAAPAQMSSTCGAHGGRAKWMDGWIGSWR